MRIRSHDHSTGKNYYEFSAAELAAFRLLYEKGWFNILTASQFFGLTFHQMARVLGRKK